jgi:hypothetical protein
MLLPVESLVARHFLETSTSAGATFSASGDEVPGKAWCGEASQAKPIWMPEAALFGTKEAAQWY